MKNIRSNVSLVEEVLVVLNAGPWDAVYRVAVGFATVPAMLQLRGEERSSWLLMPFLLGIFLAMRLLPAIARKLIPFPERVQRAWAERRQMAKRYDSYQWQKLFWIGIGLAIYLVTSGQFHVSPIIVAAFCLLSGATGLIRWQTATARIERARIIHTQARSSLTYKEQ